MRLAQLLFSIVVLSMLAGCEVIGGIFKAGVWVGVLAVVAVIVLIAVVVSKMRG